MKPKLNTVIVPFPKHTPVRSVFPYQLDDNKPNKNKAILISNSKNDGSCVLPQTLLLDNIDGTLTSTVIEKWLNQYEKDRTSFISPVLFTRAKLFEMQNMTSHLMKNHPFRIAIIADLFTKLSAYPVYETVLQPFRNEIFHFLFGNQYNPQKFDTYQVRDFLQMLQINEKYHAMGIYRSNTVHACIKGGQQTATMYTPTIVLRNKMKQVQAKLSAVHHFSHPKLSDNRESDIRAQRNIQFLKQLVTKHDKKLLIIITRVWSFYSKRKKRQISTFLDKSGFKARSKTMKSCFQSWLKYKNISAKAKLQMKLETAHVECVQLKVLTHQLRKKLEETEKSAREHITALAMDLDNSNASDGISTDKEIRQWNEAERKLNVQWIRYIATNYKNQLTEIRNKLDGLFEKKLFDPMLIGDVLANVPYKNAFQFTILNSENIESISSEALLLNWVNFILTGHGTSTFFGFEQSNSNSNSNSNTASTNQTNNNSISETSELSVTQSNKLSTADFTFSTDTVTYINKSNLDKTETFDISNWNKPINNFSIDFQTGDVYLVLLTMLFGDLLSEQYTVRKLANLTNGQKIETVLKQFESLGFNSDDLLSYDSIADGRADLNFVMISRLINVETNCQIVLNRHSNRNVFQHVYDSLDYAMYRVSKLFKSRKNRDQTAVIKIQKEVDSTIDLATKEYDIIYRNHNAWIKHQKTVLKYCTKILQSNVVNNKMPCILNNDPLYKEMVSSMISIINFDSLQQHLKLASKTDRGLKAVEDEQSAIISLTKKNQSLLTQIFIHYAGISARRYPILIKNISKAVIDEHLKYFNKNNEPSLIHLNEFVKLMHDASIPDETIPLVRIKSILDATHKTNDNNSNESNKKVKKQSSSNKKPSKPKGSIPSNQGKTSIASRTARYKIKNHVKLKQEQTEMLSSILPYSLDICDYILMLLKIAKIKFDGVSQSLTQSFQILIEAHLKSMFEKITNDGFRKAISLDPSMQKLLAQHETTKLYPIFQRCVSISNILRDRNKATVASTIRAHLNGNDINESDNSWRSNSTVAGIAQVLSRNCGLFELAVANTNEDISSLFGTNTSLNEAIIHQLIKVIQQSATSNQDPFYCQVVYEEFVQLIVAIAMYTNNNPFQSINDKVQHFLDELKFRAK